MIFIIGEMQIVDDQGHLLGITENNEVKAEIVQKASTQLITQLADKDTVSYKAGITPDGRIKIIQPGPVPPEGTNKIQDILQNEVSDYNDHFTVIPNGEIVTIQRLTAGSEYVNGGVKVEIWYAPNGNTTGIELIDAIYINGSSNQVDLEYVSPEGDGTRAILLRRDVFSGGTIEIYGKWEGYY